MDPAERVFHSRYLSSLILFIMVLAPPLALAANAEDSRKIRVQVAVVADSADQDPTEQSGAEIRHRQELLWQTAGSIRKILIGELQNYPEGEAKIFEVIPDTVFTDTLVPKAKPRRERDAELHARLGLGGTTPGPETIFPNWICSKLMEAQSDLAVLAHLQPHAAVIKIVMARPCLVIGSKASDSAKSIITDEGAKSGLLMLIQNGLGEILDKDYQTHIQVTSTEGLAFVLDGQTIGQLPIANAVKTYPGEHELRTQGNDLCDRAVLALPPGEYHWAPKPCQQPRTVVWVAAGVALLAGGAAVVSHLDQISLEQDFHDAPLNQSKVHGLHDDATMAAWRTNILYGVAGGAVLFALGWYLFEPHLGSSLVVVPDEKGGSLFYVGKF